MIVVTGATGNVGGEAARLLTADGHPVRLVVRDPKAAPGLPGVEVAVAGYGDQDALARALRPGDRVFMVSINADHDERLALHRSFVTAAARAQVAQLVYLSFLNASHDSVFAHSRSHAETEDMIRDSGLPFTFVRTSLYGNVLAAFHLNGLMRAPGGTGRVSWVERKDCGAVVAAALREPGHEGAIYDATGPEALTLAESSQRVADLLGVPYRYEDADDPAALPAEGIPAWAIPVRRTCFLAIAAGELGTVGDAVQRIGGRDPAPIDRYILEHPGEFPAPPG